jgi:hypothetical protein
MAVKLIATIQNFHGLSTDAKPVSPPEGSTFHAVDTGEAYVYYDGTWEQDLRLIYALRTAATI